MPSLPFRRISHSGPRRCFHMRLPDALQPEFLNQPGYVFEPRPHIDGKLLDLGVDDSVQGLDRPCHAGIFILSRFCYG